MPVCEVVFLKSILAEHICHNALVSTNVLFSQYDTVYFILWQDIAWNDTES